VHEIFLFISSGLALGPIQPPFQLLPGVLSLRFKAAGGLKLTAIIAKLKNEWSHPSTPAARLHNVDREKLYCLLCSKQEPRSVFNSRQTIANSVTLADSSLCLFREFYSFPDLWFSASIAS
jgi:hypothetical protein